MTTQKQDIDPGKPWDKSNPNPGNPMAKGNPEAVHPVVMEDDKIKASGRHAGGLPNEPLVTVNPTSKPVARRKQIEPQLIHDVTDELIEDGTGGPYDDLDVGSGLLIAVEPNQTIDQCVLKAHKQVFDLNKRWSVYERNDHGERILDNIMVEELRRNDDKSIQLDADSKPIVGANQTYTPRRIQIRQYAVKPVTANDKFENDGALIIRVFQGIDVNSPVALCAPSLILGVSGLAAPPTVEPEKHKGDKSHSP